MLNIKGLKIHYRSGILKKRITRAVDGIDLSIGRGTVFGLTGESGCGKTTLALAVLRLIEPTGGTIWINGKNHTELKGKALRKNRQNHQIIWQNPEASLNPRMRISDNILEPARYYKTIDRNHEKDILKTYCEMVELPTDVLSRYPHEISGGENQRAVIARILTLQPELLIADEPTAALDILVQAQILDLIKHIQKQMNITILFISHDLNVIRHMCHKIAVMHQGRIIEQGPCDKVLGSPETSYTKQLVEETFGDWRSAS